MADYLARIAESEERARELEAQLLDPEIARQAGEYQKLAKALGGLRPLLEVGQRYREVIEQLEDSRSMLDDSDAELAAAISKLKALKLLLHPPKPAGPARCAESRSGGHNKKGDTLEAIIASKNESFAAWYAELVVKSELIEYYDISGCYILRPWAFSI